MENSKAVYSVAHSAVCLVAWMGEMTAVTMDACWAGQKAALTEAMWAVY